MNIKHSLLIAVTSLSALTAANAQEKVEVKVTGLPSSDAATYLARMMLPRRRMAR